MIVLFFIKRRLNASPKKVKALNFIKNKTITAAVRAVKINPK